MARTKTILGKVPIGRGAYSNNTEYYKENTVTLYGMSFRAISDKFKGYAPARIDGSGNAVLQNTDKWELLSGHPEAYNNNKEVEKLNQRVDNQDKTIKAYTEKVDKYKPIVINGDVINTADEEDITSDENKLLKLKDRPATDGMGYVILRKNKTFAEQVAQPNTIYEIRYNFDLGGAEVEIPENCLFKFEGGSLKNGVLNGNSTILTGEPKLNILFAGTWVNEEIYASWVLANTNAERKNIIASIFSLGKVLALDTNITLDGSVISVTSLNIKGYGYGRTISNMCAVNVDGDVFIENATFSADSTIPHIVKVNTKSSVFIKNVEIIGNNNIYRGLHSEGLTKCNIENCNITGVLYYGIHIDGEVNHAVIKNCYIHDFGVNISENNARRTVTGIQVGNNSSYCQNVYIDSCVLENILCGYANGNDKGECHGILVYGDYSRITGCTVRNIYTLIDGVESDAGSDCEGLYTKGNHVIIDGNNIIYANGGGENSFDGAITAKLSNYARITNNTVRIKYGNGIVITDSYSVIANNAVLCEKNILNAITSYSGGKIGVYNIIRNNRIEMFDRETGSSPCPIFVKDNENMLIESNVISGFPWFNICYCSTPSYQALITFKGNTFMLENIDTIEELNQNYLIYTQSSTSEIRCEYYNNTFSLKGVRSSSLYMGSSAYSNYKFINNEFKLLDYSGESPVMENGKCSFHRLLTGIRDFSGNNIEYGTNAKVGYFLSQNSNGMVQDNTFDGITALPILEGQNIARNKLLRALTSGDSTDRPAKNSITVGMSFFDTKLNKPIYWTGTAWVDATGAEV